MAKKKRKTPPRLGLVRSKNVNTGQVCEILADHVNKMKTRAYRSVDKSGFEGKEWDEYEGAKGLAAEVAKELGFHGQLRQRGGITYCTPYPYGKRKKSRS